MQTKIVEPGTIKTGTIISVSLGKGNKDPYAPRVIAIHGRDNEGYLLLNGTRYNFVPTSGQDVEYVAEAGGPTGIYWKLTREVILSQERWDDLFEEIINSNDISIGQCARTLYVFELLKAYRDVPLPPKGPSPTVRSRFLDNVSRSR